MQCPVCHVDYKSYTAVSLHFRSKHGTSLEFKEIMRLKFIDEQHGGKEPTCKCGCGGVPKYYDYERGYVEYVPGHHSRVHNNWGHNAGAQVKSQDVRREMHQRGEITIWNKGETKQTSVRVAELGETQSRNFTPERRIIRSKRMTQNRLSKVVPDLKGKEHGMWRGGSSALQPLARARLHSVWTYPKLRASGFKCAQCGQPGPGLEVHHDQERFASILQKAIAIFGELNTNASDGDFERKSSISEWVADYHVDNDVSGTVLCEACHQQEHVSRA